MSHAASSVTLQDVPLIVAAKPLQISVVAKVVLVAGMVVGLLAFIDGLNGSASAVKHTWAVFLVNFIYWFFIAAAATCFSAVFQICNAQWVRPIRRVFESASRYFLFSLIPLVVLYFGHRQLFEWADPHASHVVTRGIWLTSNFLFARDILALLLVAYIGRRVVFLSIGQDIGAVRSGLTGVEKAQAERWYSKQFDSLVVGWPESGVQGVRDITAKMGFLSPIVVIVFALCTSLIAFDLVMSIDAHWYSTLFGAFMFMSGVYGAMAWTAIGVTFVRELHPIYRAKVERRTLHDLGKLLFGFGIFWAYLFWAHYLTIWYANMPEETHWVILRLRNEPWHSWSWMVLGCCFFIPFLLGLSRDVKQVPRLLFGTALIVAVGLWMQTYLFIAPELFPTQILFSWVDLFISLGFMSAFLLSAASFLEQVPLVPFGDLYADPKPLLGS